MKVAILAESGDDSLRDPCEGCIPQMKVAILAESGDDSLRDPCEGCSKNENTQNRWECRID